MPIELKDEADIARILIATDARSLIRSLDEHESMSVRFRPYVQTTKYFGTLYPDFEWISLIHAILKVRSGNIVDMLRFGDPCIPAIAKEWREHVPIPCDGPRMDRIVQSLLDSDHELGSQTIYGSYSSNVSWSDPWIGLFCPTAEDGEESFIMMSPALPKGVCAFRMARSNGIGASMTRMTRSFLHPKVLLGSDANYAWEYSRESGDWTVLDGDATLDPYEMPLTMNPDIANSWSIHTPGFLLQKRMDGEWELELSPYGYRLRPELE